MTVADRIKQRRIELELSQDELARRAGYSDKTSISKFENAGDSISMKQIKRLAPALNCSSVYLMGWTSDPKKTEADPIEVIGNPYIQITDIHEIELIITYRKCSCEIKNAVRRILNLKEIDSEKRDSEINSVS